MVTLTKKQVQEQLLRFFDGDKERLKALAKSCKELGFPIGDNIESIVKYPEHFSLLITYSDLGILSKLTDSLEVLKQKGK